MRQVVIEIPDHIYEALVETGKYGYYKFDAKKAIRNGTPLPKGHGKIVDISTLEYLKTLNAAIHNKITWSKAIAEIKDSALTIIEADEEVLK